jgi:hypothetical protein
MGASLFQNPDDEAFYIAKWTRFGAGSAPIIANWR